MLVPVDKAAKNVAVICKRFHTEVLLEEMESNSDTYTKKSEDCTALSSIHHHFVKTLNLSPTCDKLPYNYWGGVESWTHLHLLGTTYWDPLTGLLDFINLPCHNTSLYLMQIAKSNLLLKNIHWHSVLY